MSEAMVVQGSPAPAVPDRDQAYKLGRLCGEVRILKWGVGAAFVAILGCMGVLYEAIDGIRVELIETRKDVSVLQADTASIRKDVAVLKEDVAVLKQDVAVLKEDVAVLKQDVAVLKEDVAVLKQDVAVLKQDVAVLKEDVAVLKEDVAVLKEDVAVLKQDVAVLKEDVADLKAMHSPWMEDAHGRRGNSRGFPKHAGSAGEPVPPARTTPLA